MTPLILLPLGLLLAAAAAGAAPTAVRARAPVSRVRVRRRRVPTRPPKTVRARRAAAKKRKVAAQVKKWKDLAKKIGKVEVVPHTKKGGKFIRQMIKTAQDMTKPPAIRKAAAKAAQRAATAPPRRATPAELAEARRLLAARAARERAELQRKIAAKREISKAVIKAEETTKPTPDQAAKALRLYTRDGGNQGTKAYPSETVRKAQEILGLTPDGIIGPKTRRRCKELGYTLYPRSYQKRGRG